MSDEQRAELVEELAGLEHVRWSNWQRYLHECCIRNPDGSLTIPIESVKHWERQIRTDYADLTEREKESDRREARNTIAVVDRLLAERDIDAMLNAVPAVGITETRMLEDGTATASVYTLLPEPWLIWKAHKGTGPTRVAAIADACRKAKAKDVQHGTD